MQISRPYHEFSVELNTEELLSYQFSEVVFEWVGGPVTVDIMVNRKTKVWHTFGAYEGSFAHIIVGPIWAIRFRQEKPQSAKGRAPAAPHSMQVSGACR
jgi:hypothetical protein